jgi:hypothetical protein
VVHCGAALTASLIVHGGRWRPLDDRDRPRHLTCLAGLVTNELRKVRSSGQGVRTWPSPVGDREQLGRHQRQVVIRLVPVGA